MTIDRNYFPGWTRKCVTFSIDDGSVPNDRKFLCIVNPAGIRGTFNLCSHLIGALTPQGYRQLYRGHGIANHMKYHPFAFEDGMTYRFSDRKMPTDEKERDPALTYPSDVAGLYKRYTYAWRDWAPFEAYLRFADQGKEELENIFGIGSVRDFVWPFSEQKNADMRAQLVARGYRSIRKTGAVGASTQFSMPADRFAWTYNANNTDLVMVGETYMAYPDDGKMKFFCIGVHSVDYENGGQWEDLKKWCEMFGNKPDEYYSAPVGEIFAYEDAMRALIYREGYLINPTDIDLYVKVNGERVLVRAADYCHVG